MVSGGRSGADGEEGGGMRRKNSITRSLKQAEIDHRKYAPGLAKDGSIAGDYLAAGRDPSLKRPTMEDIEEVLRRSPIPGPATEAKDQTK